MMDDIGPFLFKVCFPLKRNVTYALSHQRPIVFIFIEVYLPFSSLSCLHFQIRSSHLLLLCPPTPHYHFSLTLNICF